MVSVVSVVSVRARPLLLILCALVICGAFGEPSSPCHCTDLPTWKGTGVNPSDCRTSLYFLMQTAEVQRHRRFDFLPDGMPATHDRPVQRVPYKQRIRKLSVLAHQRDCLPIVDVTYPPPR